MLRIFTFIIMTLLLSGCNDGDSDKPQPTKTLTTPTGSIKPQPTKTLTTPISSNVSPLPQVKSNIFTVINGFLDKANSTGKSSFGQFEKISVSNSIPLFKGVNIPSTPIQLLISPFPAKGGSKQATVIIETGGWHCYKSTDLVAERNNKKIIVDGKIEEYAYDYSVQQCGDKLIASYEFHNATMDANLKLEQPNTAFFIDSAELKIH